MVITSGQVYTPIHADLYSVVDAHGTFLVLPRHGRDLLHFAHLSPIGHGMFKVIDPLPHNRFTVSGALAVRIDRSEWSFLSTQTMLMKRTGPRVARPS